MARTNVHKKIHRPIAPECLHQWRKFKLDPCFSIVSIKSDTHHDEESYCKVCTTSESFQVKNCVKILDATTSNILVRSERLNGTTRKATDQTGKVRSIFTGLKHPERPSSGIIKAALAVDGPTRHIKLI